MSDEAQNDTQITSPEITGTQDIEESVIEPSSQQKARKYADKYDSPEELEKAYKELNKMSTTKLQEAKEAQELVQGISEYTGMTAQDIKAEIASQRSKAESTQSRGNDSETMRQLQATEARLAKMEFAQQWKDIEAETPELKDVREQAQKIFMSQSDTSIQARDIVNEYYQPVIKASKEATAQRLRDQASTTPQSTQRSGVEVTDEAKKLKRELSQKRSITEDDAVALLQANKKK